MTSQFSVTAAEVKKEARNVHVNDVADADVDRIIEEIESIIFSNTKKSDWTTSHDEFEALRGATRIGAASRVLMFVGDPENKSGQLWEEFKWILSNISVQGPASKAEAFKMTVTDYRSSPLKDE